MGKSPKMPGPSQAEIDAAEETRRLNIEQRELIAEQKADLLRARETADKAAAEQKAAEKERVTAGSTNGSRALLSGNWSGYERADRPRAVASLLGGGFRRGGDLSAV